MTYNIIQLPYFLSVHMYWFSSCLSSSVSLHHASCFHPSPPCHPPPSSSWTPLALIGCVWGFVEVEGVSLLSSLAGRQQQARCGARPCRTDYTDTAEQSQAGPEWAEQAAVWRSLFLFPCRALRHTTPELGFRENGNEKLTLLQPSISLTGISSCSTGQEGYVCHI